MYEMEFPVYLSVHTLIENKQVLLLFFITFIFVIKIILANRFIITLLPVYLSKPGKQRITSRRI